jgi:hypothetical protein
MTLILAEAGLCDGFIVADTLLTVVPSKYNTGPFNGKYHALKVHILSENLCIALAGNYELGLNIINQAYKYISNIKFVNNTIFDVIFSLYEEECKKQSKGLQECEFLVMLISSDGNKLKKVAFDGARECKKAYIGNQEVYKQLQSVRVPGEYASHQRIQQPDGTFITIPFAPTELEKNFVEIAEAMTIIPLREKEPSVGVLGDAVTRVRVNRFGKFEYMQQVQAGSTPYEDNIGISMLTSSYPKYGIGIFYQVGFGYCWIVGDTEYCRSINANTIQDFIQKASEEYNLNLVGGTW